MHRWITVTKTKGDGEYPPQGMDVDSMIVKGGSGPSEHP